MKNILCLFILSSLIKRATGQMEKCTPCEGPVDSSLSFDGVPCDYWASVAGHNPAGSAQCAFDRMVGIWFCGCPVPEGVTESCTLCADGSQKFDQLKTFPDSQIKCDDISEIPAIDGQQTCRELFQMSGYCECPKPETPPADAEKCTICPNGEAPATPDRIFLTTGESCQQIMDTLDFSPHLNCGKFIPNMMVDYESYCGCPDTEPPNRCSLCPEGTNLADPDHPIQYVPGSTCKDFEEYTKYITDQQLCDYMHEIISLECCEGLDPALTNYTNEAEDGCGFCPGGRDVLMPERPLVGSNMTCADLADRPDENGLCDMDRFKTDFDSLMDTQVYCVCPGSEKTGQCNFCPPGEQLLYPDNLIESGVVRDAATCAEYAAMADAATDRRFCDAIQQLSAQSTCCGVPEETNATLSSPEPTGPMCNLCTQGGAVAHGDRLFLGTSVTCDTYYDEMSKVPLGEMCDDIFGDFATTFDPEIYCGCPKAESTGQCNLCPDGSEVLEPTIWISDIFTTCGQIDDIAHATSDQEFCASIQRVGQYYCCSSPGSPAVGEEGSEFFAEESSAAPAGEGGTRRLRSTSNDEELSAPTNRVGSIAASSVLPYHFSAIKAMDKVQKKVANLVNKQNLALQLDFEDEQHD